MLAWSGRIVAMLGEFAPLASIIGPSGILGLQKTSRLTF
jgi:hypothetical protein